MESTAQYWKPVWEALERFWKAICQSREGAGRMSGTLHLAQALSNRGRRGRKSDFRDAARWEAIRKRAGWLCVARYVLRDCALFAFQGVRD